MDCHFYQVMVAVLGVMHAWDLVVLSQANKQTESDKIKTGSFIYSVKGKGTKLGTLQAFVQTLTVFILCTNYPSNPTMPTQLLFV